MTQPVSIAGVPAVANPLLPVQHPNPPAMLDQFEATPAHAMNVAHAAPAPVAVRKPVATRGRR